MDNTATLLAGKKSIKTWDAGEMSLSIIEFFFFYNNNDGKKENFIFSYIFTRIFSRTSRE